MDLDSSIEIEFENINPMGHSRARELMGTIFSQDSSSDDEQVEGRGRKGKKVKLDKRTEDKTNNDEDEDKLEELVLEATEEDKEYLN